VRTLKIFALAIGLGLATEGVLFFLMTVVGGPPAAIIGLVHWPGFLVFRSLVWVVACYALLWSLGWYFVVRRFGQSNKTGVKK
jgi:hypothetical protein